MSSNPFSLFNTFARLLLLTGLLSSCNSTGDGEFADSSLLDSSYASGNWPNESTTNTNYNAISSKILVSDLNTDGVLENIFISRVRRSTNEKSYMIRITTSTGFQELANFTSPNATILKDSTPFAYDLNKDGLRELLFVSFNRYKIYAFEFHNKDLDKLKIRWVLTLPHQLLEDYKREMSIEIKDKLEVIRVEDYFIYETKDQKPKIL